MIRIQRSLSFDEYATANRLVLLHGTRKRRFYYWLNIRILPVIAIVCSPWLFWHVVVLWKRPGDQGMAVGLASGLIAYAVIVASQPLLLRRKMKTAYKQQELHREWLLEVSHEGIHSVIPGMADSNLAWAYFDIFTETPTLFVIMKKVRPVFISLPKTTMDEVNQQELRGLLAAHLRGV